MGRTQQQWIQHQLGSVFLQAGSEKRSGCYWFCPDEKNGITQVGIPLARKAVAYVAIVTAFLFQFKQKKAVTSGQRLLGSQSK
jgi:hypothetical protein